MDSPSNYQESQDEMSFMNNLLSDIDASFLDNVSVSEETLNYQAVQENSAPKEVHEQRPKFTSETDYNISMLLDGAEEWDWDDMIDDALNVEQKDPKLGTGTENSATTTTSSIRCVVESTENYGVETSLNVRTIENPRHITVLLRDDWTQLNIQKGDTINVICDSNILDNETRHIVITRRQNLVIIHPDLLITATSVSNATHCARRSILSTLLSSSNTTLSVIYGNFLHEVAQQCLAAKRWDEVFLDARINDVIQKGINDLFSLNISLEQAGKDIKAKAKSIKLFCEKYMRKEPKPDSIISSAQGNQGTTTYLAISNVCDIEEDIWAPKYGLKGKIDATVQVVIDAKNAVARHREFHTMPLEIKTGHQFAAMEHRAQTILYTLLISERYGTETPAGLLFYTQNEEVSQVPARWKEIRSLIMMRNDIAGYLMTRLRATGPEKHMDKEFLLPSTIDQERSCSRCYVADGCMLYRKAVEEVQDKDSAIAQLYTLKTDHLSVKHTEFFQKWERLISMEEKDLIKFRKEIWMMGACEREQKGRCLSSMRLDSSFIPPRSYTTKAKDTRIRQFIYRFVRHQRPGMSTSDLLHGHIVAGDAVIVSVDPHLIALARGFVLELKPNEIIVSVDHVISIDYVHARLPNFDVASIIFRIDKDEMMGGFARIRNNLAQLFYTNGNARLRNLIVDLDKPVFAEPNHNYAEASSELNTCQRQAVNLAMNALDYALILGMPGTGKTTTVAELIRILVKAGKTVLLTSHTHSAVDSILLKLKDNLNFQILRLGNTDKVHPGNHGFTLSSRNLATTIEQLETQLLKPAVVATTCLSIDHALFTRRRFDYCIVDEASQITLPTCLGPLRYADKFILVGDHFQLPPLVRNLDARKGGFDVSLFKRLSDAHPGAVIDLVDQFRMNADIMLLSNKLIYSDRLKCGSQEVAHRSLVLPMKLKADEKQSTAPWIWELLKERRKSIFVDTDAVPAKDSKLGDLIQNKGEALLVQQFVEALIQRGVTEEQIGVISPYRQQIKLLSLRLQSYKNIELLTADRSQGREKDCIIISLVRSNDECQVGDLLKDWRRINVAFTRARAKLVVFGSRKTLQASPLLADFFTLMEDKNWILTLPADACIRKTSIQVQPPTKRLLQSCNSENDHAMARSTKRIKKGTMSPNALRSRPVLQDLLNSLK